MTMANDKDEAIGKRQQHRFITSVIDERTPTFDNDMAVNYDVTRRTHLRYLPHFVWYVR